MKKTKFMAVLMAALMLLVNLAPVVANAATSNSPYCRISYDAAVGCNTVKYYGYVNGKAKYDANRLVKFYGGQLLLGTNNTLVTSKHKDGSNPGWTPEGKELAWLEIDSTLWIRNFISGIKEKIAANVASLNLNDNSMAETVTFLNGTSASLASLIKNPLTTPKPTATSKPTSTPAAPTSTPKRSVKEWTDSIGIEHFEFNSNEVKVDGSDVYFNDIKISELCDSAVKYLGIDSSNRVYLYEDKSKTYYRFSTDKMFFPEKLGFSEDCTLKSVITDKNGFLIEVKTSNGTFKIGQLVADKEWYPATSYAINKSGYCTYYLAETNTTYILTLKDTKLYLGDVLVSDGITRKSDSFGFEGFYIHYVKGSFEYKAPLNNPTNAILVKQNVAKLLYSNKNGQVTDSKQLDTKMDYVKNSSTKSVLYQNGTATHTIKMNKAKNKIYLNGKIIAKLTKKQQKKGYKFVYVGFFENGEFFYTHTYAYYHGTISAPKKAKVWNADGFYRSSLGFVKKTNSK